MIENGEALHSGSRLSDGTLEVIVFVVSFAGVGLLILGIGAFLLMGRL